jgi:hypothetical protein
MTIEQTFAAFIALGGVASFVAVVVNILKSRGVIGDGDAPKVAFVLNLVLFAVFGVALNVLGVDLTPADPILNNLAEILKLLFGITVQQGLTVVAHKSLRGAPIIGFSHTLRARQANR